METSISHLYLYVTNPEVSYKFYKPLLELLGYSECFNKRNWGFAFVNKDTSIWFEQAPKDHINDGYHRRRVGLNHIAFKVRSKEEVDNFYREFLKPNNIGVLYETPKPFPQYSKDYYAVFFEDPEKMKLEIVSHP
ncbi:MAG: VOC family protein [Patescibacteria group bacterium]|nr:VOC family protein [Patescibacteria group bacterium]